MFEEIAFNLLELGYTQREIIDCEITFLMGYAIKKMERNKQTQDAAHPATQDGWQIHGNKRRKTMTSEQALAKVRGK